MLLLKQYKKHCKKHSYSEDNEQIRLISLLDKYLVSLYKQNKFFSSLLKNHSMNKSGIYIYGEVGRGKSMLMDLFFSSLNLKKKIKIHFHQFMLNVHQELHKLRKEAADPLAKLIDNLSHQYQVICLDELQVNNIADAMIVGRLFKGLQEKKVFVVMTSNRIPDDLFKDGLQREHFLPFIDLINNEFELFSLDHPYDYRELKEKSEKQVYFNLRMPVEADAFDLLCKQTFSETHKEKQQIIVDNDRVIDVPVAYKQTAMFDFSDLCIKARGSVDFIAICKQYNTVIVRNVPKMGSDDHNEALRFITLIDCLYEHQTKLICSADANIEKLYSGKTNSFEFQRTISRLKEMTSKDHNGCN